MNKNVKADFNNLYSSYSPTPYMKSLVQDLRYELPFLAMEKLKCYSRALLPYDVVRVTVAGSCHGLDAVALKYDMTVPEIAARWSNGETVNQPFPESESEYEVTLIDIEPEPLRFARDVNLSSHEFVADLCKPYSPQLKQHFSEMTDIVSTCGATPYIGMSGMENLIQTAFVNGKAKILCFVASKYSDPTAWIDLCLTHGFIVCNLGDLRLRFYRDEEEKQRTLEILKKQGLLSKIDETGLVVSLFLAYKEDMILNSHDIHTEKCRTLIVVEQETTFIGATEQGPSHAISEWPHPWHIALSKEDAENRMVAQKLIELHTKGDLQPGDVLTTIKTSSINNVEHWANTFADAYEVNEHSLPNGQIQQILTRVT